ncbi:protein tic 21, chloroplastic, partial [Nicotiana attenuata]
VYLKRIHYQILSHLKWVISKAECNRQWTGSWVDICQQVLLLIPKIDYVVVKWHKPPEYWLKINTDGSKDAEVNSGIGGICRDHRGKLTMAFASSIGKTSSNMAEASAALAGVEWRSCNGCNNIILECDSQLVVDLINGKSKPPWQMQVIIRRIQDIAGQLNCAIRHCYREANQFTDALAKWSIDNEELLIFSHHDLPIFAVGPYMVSLRHKHRKNTFCEEFLLIAMQTLLLPAAHAGIAPLALPSARKSCRVGFWGQLVYTLVAAVILSFSVIITGKITSPFTFYSTAGGIAAAFVSVFWSFGYIRFGGQLMILQR